MTRGVRGNLGVFGRLSAAAGLAFLAIGLAGAQSAPLATYAVNSTSDTSDGSCDLEHCSLREAIIAANANGDADTIEFNIPGAAPHTIQPASLLFITQPVTIDGRTQAGFSGTPVIELDGSLAGGSSDGLFINSGGPVTIRGLVINRFAREGIHIQGTGAVTVEGNFIGTNVAGSAALPNGLRGILLNGSSGHTIGGDESGPGLDAGNLISGNNNVGISVQGGSNNTIQGNRIGMNLAFTAALPNGPGGIQLLGGSAPFGAAGNIIGGTAPGRGNLISGNTGPGILLNTNSVSPGITNNTIQGNLIGPGIGNSGSGISIVNVGGIADNTIGGTATGAANTIAHNGGDGISIQSATGNLRNAIRGNAIFANTGIGIDLGENGVSANDTGDADTGANDFQNFPILSAATATTVSGVLETAASQTYDVDVYTSSACDSSGNGEGETHVASFQVTTDTSGHAGFTNQPLSPSASGFVTATATDDSGNTSEFSACQAVSGGGSGGSLSGVLAQTGGNFNLTTTGTQDWAVWGFASGGTSTSLAPDVSKAGGSGISALTDINPTGAPLRGIGQFTTATPFTFDWSNGTGPATTTGAYAGLQHDGQPSTTTQNDGFSFTVPADTTSRTLRVYVSVHSGTGRLTATLSDGSAPTYLDSGLVGPTHGANVGGLYTLTYSAASPGQTLTVEWIESISTDFTFFADNVAIYAVSLEGPGGGGGPADPPVLFAAVPNANGPTLGVAGVFDAGVPGAGTQFDISFFSVPQCDPAAPKTPLGARTNLVTNATGVGAFAIDGLANVAVGTLVTATASLGGDPSPISNCVVADRNNTSWLTALELTPNDNQSGHLRSQGEARWFKVPILPNSRVDISLSGLPADYDLVVFSDIQAAYDRLNGGADYNPVNGPNLALDDLAKQGADTPVDVFNTSQYNPSSWDPTNWNPSINSNVFSPQFSPTQWSPTQWSATQWSPTQWSPTQWSPTQWSPTQWSPTQWSPTQWSPTQWSPTQWSSSNPSDPKVFSAAQTASLLAVSGGTGTGDESVSVNTWNNTGFFYMRVQGKNGSFDPGQPFTLGVARQGNPCQGVVDQPSSPSAPAGDRKTVILVDGSRMTIGPTLSAKLNTFVGRTEVRGAIVDVNGDPAVSSLNAQADGKKGCPFAKNLVASAITRIVDAYRAGNPIKYVVVVGDDSVIPFHRYPDPALLGNENLYLPPVTDDSASQASLRLGYVLNQDGYGSSDSVSLHGNQFPVPDLAVGRLVETPTEIEGMLDAYLGTTAGVVPTPTSSLVTGYDFLQDAADVVSQHLSAGIGGASNHTLITNRNVSPGTVTVGTTPDRNHSWTGADLRRSLFDSGRHDLIFLAGHFSANDALGADYRTNVLSTELPASTTSFVNSIVFSAGCHAGYNIVNGDATTVTEPLDWAQAFARKQATLISGTGYQYGDTDFLAHSERIYAEFAQQLRVTGAGGPPVPVAVGDALLRSKRIFLETTPGLTSLDEKALLQTTLFGLPMLSVNLPQGRIVEAPDGTVVTSVTPVGPGPGSELGLGFADLPLPSTLTPASLQLTGGPLATYLSGPDGVAVRPTQPIVPLDSLNVTSPNPGLILRGVAFRAGSYTDTNGVTPLTAAPATELRGVHAPFFTDVFFPTQPWTANFFDAFGGGGGGATRLHVTPVQHRSNLGGNLTTSTRRQFSNLSVRLFYSGNLSSYCPGTNPRALAPCPGGVAVAPALAAPPTITGVETSFDQNTSVLTFNVRILGDPVAGIQTAWVTWTIPPAAGQTGGWQSFDLVLDPDDSTLWTGTLSLPSGTDPGLVNFVVQAVNGVGRVTIDDNVGAFYRPGSIPGAGSGGPPPATTTMTFTTSAPASVVFGGSFPVTIRLTAGGSPVSGKLVRIGLGAAGIPAFTNANGRATVTLQAALTPDSYLVTASFAGDATHAASDASDTIAVTARPTSLTLSGTLGTRTLGSSLSITATLQAASPSTPLHQRSVFVIIRGTGPGNNGVTEVFPGKTDPLGRVDVPASTLSSLPAGNYTVDAYFNGVNVPGVLVVAPDDVGYAHSEAHATLALTAPGSAPTCNGQTATIYVDAQGRIVGGPDNGKLYSGKLKGAGGADIIVGTGGTDDIDAKGGNDVVCSGGGNDVLEGAGGNDRLIGEAGNDTLKGAGGNDTMTGGLGADTFNGGGGTDTATDFNAGEGDTKTGVEVF